MEEIINNSSHVCSIGKKDKIDTLLGGVELQEVKIPSTSKAREGLGLWKHMLQQHWYHVMDLVVMIGVIKHRKVQTFHLWLTHLQVQNQSEAKSSQEKPKEVRKHTDAPIIKEWVSDDEDEEMIQPKF
uniref:Uncharacterized protein n=1 Tax=Tanacetum cinerariifolium TaxID=118510 RepID=A0A699HWM7_TANCI|nr:hypothetical protein [Tanacetum cinerariifolium]